MTAQSIIDNFHTLYYTQKDLVLKKTKWFGVPIGKNPMDIMTYQEIIFETRPDVIIECGTYKGGSALFYAHMLDILGNGKVISIDINEEKDAPMHDRITYLFNVSSIDPELFKLVKSLIKPTDKVMVVLDSCHEAAHVYEELKLYSPLVTKGLYLVCEDTNINGHPCHGGVNKGGPMEALIMFINENKEFASDLSREKYLLTFFPMGWLKRVE